METGKLGKLKAKLADISNQIDEADVLKQTSKAGMIEAQSRLEKSESEVASIERRIILLNNDLTDVESRNEVLTSKLRDTEDNCQQIEESRKELEESESVGDEKIQQLEEDVKEAKRKHEETQTKLTEAQRKKVVIQRDLERATSKAVALEKRVQVLEETINNATESLKELEEREGESSLKEERNAEELVLLEGQYKEAEVRAEAAERCVGVLERNIRDTVEEIETWKEKTAKIEQEMVEMDEMINDSDEEEEKN